MHFLTHWGRVTHICVTELTIIGSDNGLSPDRRQAIIWTNAGLLLIGPLWTNFSEILIEIITFSFKENAFESVVCETAAILSRPQCVNLLIHEYPEVLHISLEQFKSCLKWWTDSKYDVSETHCRDPRLRYSYIWSYIFETALYIVAPLFIVV